MELRGKGTHHRPPHLSPPAATQRGKRTPPTFAPQLARHHALWQAASRAVRPSCTAARSPSARPPPRRPRPPPRAPTMRLSDRAVRRWDFYRRINPEFTDTSWLGAAFSVSAVLLMTALFVSELAAWLAVRQTTTVQLDTTGVDAYELNINVSFPAVPCAFLSVDVSDVLGTNRLNLTHNVHKWRLQTDPADLGRFTRAAAPLPADADADAAFAARAAEARLALESEDNFAAALDPTLGVATRVHNAGALVSIDRLVAEHPLVFVSFTAPWCPYSRALAPVWEHSAAALDSKPYRNIMAFATVDCTALLGQLVCASYHVHAFPTILVFENFRADAGPGAIAHHHKIHYFGGPRETHAFFDEAERVLNEALPTWRTIDDLSRDTAIAHAVAGTSSGVALAAVGDTGGRGGLPLEGCQIVGMLDLRRVPTNLHITGNLAPGYSFNTSELNTTHRIHHLSFGHHALAIAKPAERARLLAALRERGHSPLNARLVEQPFVMREANTTWEHFLRVVPEIYRMRDVPGEHPAYQYTTNSRAYASLRHVPEVRFSLDISPMAVVVEDEVVPLYHFLTSVCAIVGGIFTVIGFIDAAAFHGLNTLRAKVDLGKQT